MRHTVLSISPSGPGDLRHIAGPPREVLGGSGYRWQAESVLGSMTYPMDGRCHIRWSGSFAETEGGGLFDEDPRTWGPKGWGSLGTRIDELKGSIGGIALRPHARHVISDIPSCRRIIEQASEVVLCYDPASMMTPAMMARGEDHLRRMYEALELIPAERLAMVVVSGVDGAGIACGVDACGELGQTVAKFAAEWVPVGVPLVVVEERVEAQIEMLAAAEG